MCKLITYWKSNFRTELGYYGIDQRKNVHLSDDEINIHIAEAFNEIDDDDHDDDDLNLTQRSIEIPKDNCYVLIELIIWIKKFVNLSYQSIIKDIDIPKDIIDDLDENIEINNSNRVLSNSNKKNNDSNIEKGVYNYNIDNLLSSDNNDEEEE